MDGISMKVKIDQWTLSLKQREGFIVAAKPDKSHKISIEKFDEFGMLSLPSELLNLIRKNLRHANTYDRFLEKYYGEN